MTTARFDQCPRSFALAQKLFFLFLFSFSSFKKGSQKRCLTTRNFKIKTLEEQLQPQLPPSLPPINPSPLPPTLISPTRPFFSDLVIPKMSFASAKLVLFCRCPVDSLPSSFFPSYSFRLSLSLSFGMKLFITSTIAVVDMR